VKRKLVVTWTINCLRASQLVNRHDKNGVIQCSKRFEKAMIIRGNMYSFRAVDDKNGLLAVDLFDATFVPLSFSFIVHGP